MLRACSIAYFCLSTQQPSQPRSVAGTMHIRALAAQPHEPQLNTPSPPNNLCHRHHMRKRYLCRFDLLVVTPNQCIHSLQSCHTGMKGQYPLKHLLNKVRGVVNETLRHGAD